MGMRWQGRLLLVEDENLLRGLIAQFLRSEGFELVEAADGREGVERYSSLGPFDVVLLDLNLPVLLRRRGLPADQAGAPRPARDHLQRSDSRWAHGRSGVAESRPVSLQTLPSQGTLEPDRHRVRTQRRTRAARRPSTPAAPASRRADRAHANTGRSHTLFKLPAID